MADPIVARYTAELGRSLYATRAISEGDIILSDRPALLLEGNPSIPQRIEALQSPSCEILRRHLFAPDPHDASLAHHPVLRVMRLMAKSYPDPAVALRYALLWHANAFAFNGGTALFFVASLFTHSCCPNTVFDVVDDTLQFKALRSIAEGELLTISYFPPEIEIQGRRQRQDLLWREKCFWCKCERCEKEKGAPPPADDPKEAETLAALEDQIAALAHSRTADAPLAQLRERAAVLLGEAHWAHTLVLLMEADLLLSAAPLSAAAVGVLKRASAWILARHAHLTWALLGARLLRALAMAAEAEGVRESLVALCESVQGALRFAHQRRALQARTEGAQASASGKET